MECFIKTSYPLLGKYLIELEDGDINAKLVEEKDLYPIVLYTRNQIILALKNVEDPESWESATVHDILSPSLFIVHYSSDGTFNGVSRNAMKPMPGFEEREVEPGCPEVNVWMVGDLVLARWTEDNVWYKASITAAYPNGCYYVYFMDYGNNDTVTGANIVGSVDNIPDGDSVDVHVDQDTMKMVATSNYVREVVLETQAETEMSGLTVTVDNTKEVREEPAQYPNVDGEGILPRALQCDICCNLVTRAMRLACNKTPVCWGCAVKTITGSHKCWVCSEKVPNASSHLVQDQKLRDDVDVFTATGFYDDKEDGDQATKPTPETNEPYQLHDSLDFSSMMRTENGVNVLTGTKLMTVMNVPDPAGITKLKDGRLLVCCTSDNSVRVINSQGVTEGKLKSGCLGSKDFFAPSDIITRSNGEVVVCDKKGLHLFDTDLKFKKMIGKTYIDEAYGLAEDEEGRILTIHRSLGRQPPANDQCRPFITYILFIMIMEEDEDVVDKCIEMEELKEAAVAEMMEVSKIQERLESQLRTITYMMGCIYITGENFKTLPISGFIKCSFH